MAIRSGKGIWIGWAALLAASGVSSASAQFGGFSAHGMQSDIRYMDGSDVLAWHTIHAQISAKLEKIDLSRLARSLATAKPTGDPAQLMERLDVFVRAGDRTEADRVIQALAHTVLSKDGYQLSVITDFLIEHGEWELTRHLMDVCPFATPSDTDLFLAHIENSPSFPHLDSWLTSREIPNPAMWYLEYRRRKGTLQPLLNARGADIRAHPQDLSQIDHFLTVAYRFAKPPNIAWLSSVCHFPLAVENQEIGTKLSRYSADAAIPFLERALKIPLTFDDYLWTEVQYGSAPADFRREPPPEAIHLQMKSTLMQCYKTVRQFRKAQTLLEEVTAPERGGLPWNWARFAGETEAGSGVRVIEQRFQAAEAADGSDFSYWLIRADYCLGRKERDQAAQAYRRALELTAVKPGANPSEDEWKRIYAMNAYLGFLDDPLHPMPTIIWLRSELEKAPIEGDYAHALLEQMFRLLPLGRPDFLPAHETLWRYLAAHKWWGPQETRVLQEMVDSVQSAEREKVWARAEQLAGSDSALEKCLGALMESRKEPGRAIPLLEAAARQTKNEADRHAVTLAQLEDALARNDWPHAKAFWLEARHGLDSEDLTRWTQTLVDAAVQSGAADAAVRSTAADAAVRSTAADDVMELFTYWANQDRNVFYQTDGGKGQIGFVKRLVRLGLRERLSQFYHAMAVADPDSHVPQDILPSLQDPSAQKPAGRVNTAKSPPQAGGGQKRGR